MTVFEAAIAGGEGDTFDAMRAMIGTDNLALIMAKSFAEAAGFTLSPTKVAEALGMSRNGAAMAIDAAKVVNQILVK